MSVDIEERGVAGPLEPDHEAHQRAHPSDRSYLVVAVILFVITAAEVSTYYFENLSTAWLVVLLFPMMIAKFFIVCGWFMHLRYDNPLFRRVFVFGLVLAASVYAIVLTSMQFFSSSYGT